MACLDSACRVRIVYQGRGTRGARGELGDDQTLAVGGDEAGGQWQADGGVEGAGVLAVVVIVESDRAWRSRCRQRVGAKDGMETQEQGA